MNIGLVLFTVGILFGNTPDDNSTASSKNQQSEVKQESTTELDPNKQKSQTKGDFDFSANQTDDIEQFSKRQNNAPSITGNARQQVKQDEYYTFTPYAHDLDRDKLLFSIINRPKWIAFDSRTGSIIGRPGNSDVGFTKEITITVTDSYGAKASLKPFKIQVINVNDKPIISGTPLNYISPSKKYIFTPDVEDIDLKIAEDKLIFSIQNKPTWARFDNENGKLSGIPKAGHEEYTKNIIITVTDSHGLSDSLKPFNLLVANESSRLYSNMTNSKAKANLSRSNKNVKSNNKDKIQETNKIETSDLSKQALLESNEDNNRLILHACDVNAFSYDPSSGKKIQKIALTNNNLSCVKKVPHMHYLNNFLLKKKLNSNYDYFFRGESINNTADFFFIKPLNPDLI